MAKQSKTNSGSEFNAGELGAESQENSGAHSFTEGFQPSKDDFAPEKPARPERPKGKYLASGGDIYEFKNAGDVFIGRLTDRKLIREKDGEEENQKAGDVMGHYFEDPNGVPTVIGNSYQVEKAVSATKPGAVLWIEFLGKKKVGARSVNMFDIIEIDPSDYNKYGFVS